MFWYGFHDTNPHLHKAIFNIDLQVQGCVIIGLTEALQIAPTQAKHSCIYEE